MGVGVESTTEHSYDPHQERINESVDLVELIDEGFINHTLIGVPYDVYWYENGTLKLYREVYKRKTKQELDQKREAVNYAIWRMGYQVYLSLLYTSPALNAMSKGKPKDYPEYETVAEIIERNKVENIELNKIKKFMKLVDMINNERKGGGE